MKSCLNPELAQKIWAGAHCVVIGDGKSGTDALTLLKENGARTCGYTDNTKNPAADFVTCGDELSNFLQDQKCFARPDLAILSPGIPLTHPYCQHLRKCGVTIISEVELGLAFFPETTKVLGVTGTNGKSTVTDATSNLLARTGRSALPCGNIGRTVSSVASAAFFPDVAVIELSSYQLESMQHPTLHAAVFLNLTPDHLARYVTLDAYFAAKWRIVHLLKDGGKLALNSDVVRNFADTIFNTDKALEIVEVSNAIPQRIVKSCATGGALADHPGLNTSAMKARGFLSYLRAKESLTLEYRTSPETTQSHTIRVSNPHLKGEHNAENLAFVYWLASQICPVDDLFPDFCSSTGDPYCGLPHRLEDCTPSPNPWGAQIINDSKSTSFICTAHALRSFALHADKKEAQPFVVLLAGGQLKEHTIADMFREVNISILKTVITFGPEAEWLATSIREFTGLKTGAVRPLAAWQEAVSAGIKHLADGDILLFSPGAASFDAFRNFEDRGEQFKITIQRLAAGEGSS